MTTTTSPEPKAEYERRLPDSFDYGGSMAETAGAPTYYRKYPGGGDDAAAPWVVLVHGIGLSAVMYTTLAEDLSAKKGLNVLIYDLIGRGKSPSPPNATFTLQDHADQLWSLLEAVNVPAPVTLLGTSLGGAIVTYVAGKYPQNVHRAILNVPAALSPFPKLDLAARVILTPYLGAGIMWMFGSMAAKQRVTSGEAVRMDWHRPDERPLAVYKFNKLGLDQVAIPWYLNALRMCAMNVPIANMQPYAAALGAAGTFPVDVILAKHDVTCIPAPDAWKEHVPRCTLHWVDSGHCVNWEDYPAWYDIVDKILS